MPSTYKKIKAGPISESFGKETEVTKGLDTFYWGSLWCAACWAFIVASIAMGFAIDGWLRTKDIQHDSGFDISKLSSSLTDTSSLVYLSDQAESYSELYNSLSPTNQACITQCFQSHCAGPNQNHPCPPQAEACGTCTQSVPGPVGPCLAACNGCSNQQNTLSLSILESVTQNVNPTCMQNCRTLWCIPPPPPNSPATCLLPPPMGSYPCCLASCTGSQNPNCGGVVTVVSLSGVTSASTSP